MNPDLDSWSGNYLGTFGLIEYTVQSYTVGVGLSIPKGESTSNVNSSLFVRFFCVTIGIWCLNEFEL